MTKLLMDHLIDFRSMVANGHAQVIEAGGVPTQDNQILDAGKCMMLTDITQITFDLIEDFYREDEVEEYDDDEDVS